MHFPGYFLLAVAVAALLGCASAQDRPYEDLDLSLDQPQNEVVNVEQDGPHSNSIHIAHNIPKGSDITVRLTSPYNISLHISLNVATDSKVKVELSDVDTSSIHISLNGAKKCQVDAQIDRAMNSSIHLSFQNPSNTPVTLRMDSPERCQIHVSQNVPTNSMADISITNPKNNEIHVSQSAPRNSPLTFAMEGEIEDNQLEACQNAPDANSPFNCSPDCPTCEQLEYDYDYYGSAHPMMEQEASPSNNNRRQQQGNNNRQQGNNQNRNQPSAPERPVYDPEVDLFDESDYVDGSVAPAAPPLPLPVAPTGPAAQPGFEPIVPPQEQQYDQEEIIDDTPYSDNEGVPNLSVIGDYQTYADYDPDYESLSTENEACPGGELAACIDVCPGFHVKAFSLCVGECGKRCPE